MSLVRFTTKLMMALVTSMIESFAFLSCLYTYLGTKYLNPRNREFKVGSAK